MRIMIKGGVWKNTEDEILKAAVMKYGKNQWARISSLLVRKSAKQCKARWYEWLDPSIKKTEWTREEDEKLLHLAKLMPTQWRTIAPIVGRTPSQCLERYEKLLDAACARDENYEAGDDPRKLRPGEIDPNPESKPARPDPVDMDEDEKEMLSEARARLANTRGKKAKRKAREKQLEEARRLASLQKRRELKAAGIDINKRRRKRKGIDYNAEIPFEKRPPPGFYDIAGEDQAPEPMNFPTTIEELEGKRRADIEAQLRKQDVAKNKIAQRQDAPTAIIQANKMNDPEAVRKRAKLMLPAPQISDQELEEIARIGYGSDLASLASEEMSGGGGTATRALLANYSQTPRLGTTPLRTPQRTPAGKGDAIMMEAENLARLRESQTPLLGGENPELHPSDFSGVTPRKKEIQTPNPMATPSGTPGPGLTPRLGMTPALDGQSYGATPRGTPFRDELRINEEMEMTEDAKAEKRRQEELRKNLRSSLMSLPQPKNEYQIVVQPVQDEAETEERIEEDMSDRMARERAEEKAREEALLRKRSKVLQRELPRPPAGALEIVRAFIARGGEGRGSFVPPTMFEQADELINREMLALLEHDNAKYPLEEKEKEKKKGKRKERVFIPEIEDFEEDELKEADAMIREEANFLRVAMGHENEPFEEFVRARDACQDDLIFFPGTSSYGLASVASSSEKLAAVQNEFEIVRRRLDEEAKKATKLEQKIKVLTHGFQTRAGKLWSQTEATYKQVNNLSTELTCFKELQKQEQLAASYRVNNLLDEVNKQKTLESQLQRRYGDLLAESERLQNLLEEHKRKVAAESTEVGPTEGAEEMKVDNEDVAGVENDNSQVAVASEEEMKVNKEDVAGVETDASQVAMASEEEMKVDNEDVAGVENDNSQVAVASEEEMKVNKEDVAGVETDTSQVAMASEEEMKVNNEDVMARVENDASQVAAASEEEMKVDGEEVVRVENDASQVAAASEGITEGIVTGGDDKLTTELIAPEKDKEGTEKTMDGPVSDAGDASIAPGQDTV